MIGWRPELGIARNNRKKTKKKTGKCKIMFPNRFTKPKQKQNMYRRYFIHEIMKIGCFGHKEGN